MIRRVEIENFGRFRGHHMLGLGPGVYGITAQLTDDPQRSNWLGKTTFMEAIGSFVFFGEQSFSNSEDGWISRGEDHGGVAVEIDTFDREGVWRIERMRDRGKATRLFVRRISSDGRDLATFSGDDAQSTVRSLLGLDWRDFLNTCFFKQKQMSRFVTARPADRQAIVIDWLQLERLGVATKRAQSKFSTAISRQQAEDAEVNRIRDALRMLVPSQVRTDAIDFDAVAEFFDQRGQVLDHEIEAKEAKVESMREHNVKWRTYEAESRAADARRAENIERAKMYGQKKARLAEIDAHLVKSEFKPFDRTGLERLARDNQEASVEFHRLKLVAAGAFDGACPVSKGFSCPAASQINARRTENAAAFKNAESAFARTSQAFAAEQDAEREHNVAARAIDALHREKSAIEGWLESYEDLPASVEPEKPEGREAYAQADIDAAAAYLMQDVQERDRLKEQVRAFERTRVMLSAAIENAKRAAHDAAVCRHGAQLLKASQRVIAEKELLKIEGGANRFELECGIDLSMRISWGRETQGLAKACDSCGFPFPASTKVRRCEKCNAERGPHIEERLELELSDRSGAADDLAGIAIQKAARDWLRTSRGSSFDVGYIDEPFGALDAAHARALAVHIARAFGEQTFVIAHTRSIMDALPNRITVIGDGEWSRVEVERNG